MPTLYVCIKVGLDTSSRSSKPKRKTAPSSSTPCCTGGRESRALRHGYSMTPLVRLLKPIQIKATSRNRSGLRRTAPNSSEIMLRWENRRWKRLTADIHQSRSQIALKTTSQPNLSFLRQTPKLNSKVATTRQAMKRSTKPPKIQIMLSRPALSNLKT